MTLTIAALQLLRCGLRPHVLRPNDKAPLASAWQKEGNWSPAAVQRRFDAAPEGANIGVRTGDGLVVLDFDGEEGLASLQQLQAELGKLPPTATCNTRGGGQHRYFRVPGPVGNSVSRLASKVDVRGDGGQVVCPPSKVDGKGYSWAEGQAPWECSIATLPQPWLARLRGRPEATPASSGRIYPENDRAFAKERARLYLSQVEGAMSGQRGHDQTFHAACRAVGLCLSEADAREVFWAWAEKCEPRWSEKELEHKFSEALRAHHLGDMRDEQPASSRQPAPAAPGFNVSDHLAWVELMQAYVTRTRDGASWDLQHPLRKDTARMFLMSAGMSAAAAQLAILPGPQGALYAKYVDCAPGQPPSFTEGGHTVLNTFVPSSIRPEPGSWDTIRSVLAYITDGDEKALEWVLNWMAAGYQLPARRSRTAPVFYGNQRTGKTTAANVFFALLGPDNCITLRNDDIVGGGSRFTSAWATRLAVCVGEVDAAEVARATTLLKTMTGEPTVMLEAKGAQATPVDNHLKVILTSNQTCPVTVETGDTRWSLFFQGRSASAEYLAAVDELYDQTGTGGVRWSEKGLKELAAFAHYLAGLQVNFQLINRPFESRAREVVMAASMPSVPSFAAEVEAAGSLDAMMLDLIPEHMLSDRELAHLYIAEAPGFTDARAVFHIYKTWAKGAGHRPLGDKRFVAELARCRPEWGHRGDDRRVRVGGRKRSGWTGIPREPSLRPRAIPVVLTPPEETPAPEQQHPNVQQAALVLGAE